MLIMTDSTVLTDGQAVEDVDEGLPQLYAVFPFAFVVEAVDSGEPKKKQRKEKKNLG